MMTFMTFTDLQEIVVFIKSARLRSSFSALVYELLIYTASSLRTETKCLETESFVFEAIEKTYW